MATIVFAGIALGAIGVEITIYSENPYTDTLREAIKLIIPVKKPYDVFTDYLIDLLGEELGNKIKEIRDKKLCQQQRNNAAVE